MNTCEHQTIQHSTKKIKKSRRRCQQPFALASSCLPRFLARGRCPERVMVALMWASCYFMMLLHVLNIISYFIEKVFVGLDSLTSLKVCWIYAIWFTLVIFLGWIFSIPSLSRADVASMHRCMAGGRLLDFASRWWSAQMGTNGGLDKVLDSICKVVYKVVYRERERDFLWITLSSWFVRSVR